MALAMLLPVNSGRFFTSSSPHHAAALLFFELHDLIARRDNALGYQFRAVGVDHAELEIRGAFDGIDGVLLVGRRKAGQLDQDCVFALRLDERLGHTEAVNAPAEHLDRLGEGRPGIVDVGQRPCPHLHQERGAALEVQPQPDASGGFALEAIEDVAGGVGLVLGLVEREIARDVVGADGRSEVLVLLAGAFGLQAARPFA